MSDIEVMMDAIDDAATRLVLSDALEEAGRDREAALLRDGAPVVVIGGKIHDRDKALSAASDSHTQAAYVCETHDDGSPAAFRDRLNSTWDIVVGDGAGNYALQYRQSGFTDCMAAVGKWDGDTPFLLVTVADNGDEFSVNNPGELVVRRGQWVWTEE